MISFLVGIALKLVSAGVLDKVLGSLEKRADNETERQRIAAEIAVEKVKAEIAVRLAAKDVIVAGMAHRIFWVAWSIAAIPTTIWYGWGMLDTALNGALPDVAAIPPGLEPWAKTVWQSIFFSGAGVASIQAGTGVIARAIAGRK